MKKNMVYLFFLTGFLLISVNANSQDTKLSRQEKKEVRKAQLAANFYIIDTLLNSKCFVLEADYLQNKYGDRIPVSSSLNFIKVDVSTGVLQTGSDFSMGYNGVGGITAEGNVTSWEISKDAKRKSFTLRFSLSTNIGHYDIVMSVGSNARATATITGLGPGKLTWEGYLKSNNNSRVYKGQNTI